MKVIKKYTAIQLITSNVDDNRSDNGGVQIDLSYSRITGPHYSRTYPEEEFDTEEEAIEYAYKTDEYARWIIVPLIKFN